MMFLIIISISHIIILAIKVVYQILTFPRATPDVSCTLLGTSGNHTRHASTRYLFSLAQEVGTPQKVTQIGTAIAVGVQDACGR